MVPVFATSLLGAILPDDDLDLTTLSLLNTELIPAYSEDKLGVLDVRFEPAGRWRLISRFRSTHHLHAARSLFYWSRLFIGQLRSGANYSELKPYITINLLDFKYFPEKNFHTVFRLMEQQSGRVLDDVLEMHFLELPKFRLQSTVLQKTAI